MNFLNFYLFPYYKLNTLGRKIGLLPSYIIEYTTFKKDCTYEIFSAVNMSYTI